jgi:hypothetical protein
MKWKKRGKGVIMIRNAFAGLLLALFAIPAANALNPCTTQSNSGNYMIYVDPVTFASTGANQRLFLDRLRFAVESNVQELRQKLLEDRSRVPNMPQVVVIPCDPQRTPQQSIDFTKTELKSLDEFGVVLELWGLVLDATGRGQVGYALVSATSQKLANPAIYTVNRVLGSNAESVQKAFSKDPVLVAYATIAVGTRMFQNSDFSSASSYLCGGAVKLSKVIAGALKAHPDLIFVAEQKDLLSATLDLRDKALRAAGTPPSAESTCPVEKTQ